MGLADLASILWREREMLELLLFKLEEEQLVLAGGRTRWLAHATREVEVVLEEIRRTEVVGGRQGGRAARTEVKLGSRKPGLVEITEGVKAGEQIVVRGVQKVRDGEPVRIQSAAQS